VGYQELLQALEEEVRRKSRELEGEAARERERLLEETRRRHAREREKALAGERRRLDEETDRLVARLRLEQARARLSEKRRLMAALRREAEARLRASKDPGLLLPLLEELLGEAGEGPIELRVDPEHREFLEGHLSRTHPEILSRATITTSTGLGGGVVMALGQEQLLDNSLPSRLEKAWSLLEDRVAALLFGDGDAGM
jgi:vacuolar-type H+-ATPase subunit E/Vma4